MGLFGNSQENEYLMTLKDKKEQMEFLKKSKDEKKAIVDDYIKNKESKDKIDSFNKIGISKPSFELEKSFETLKLSAKIGSVMGGLAGATMSLKEQEFMKEHVSHTKQNFALMSQNEKIIKQNEEIIELLKQIANK
ncbi:hypothetical protein QP816_09340 [Staphylococcus condimenti]|uniref:hypothetical protein n=1 Tax=Staphylococcus condimenti TaxID=70255 RepID=UPI00254CCDED|nr:hypothetical protein [Staphylococcus condimenti]MDK8645794.1 hypothetical protein [Staphylococcus condimenti]